jgi:5-methylcytosine-specific restriction endonuclease McrA
MALPEKKCSTCGKMYVPIRKTSKYCTDKCRYHAFLAKKNRVTIPQDLRYSILRRDGFMCRYCGAKPVQKELRVDHIVSVKDGGDLTNTKNLITACHACNSGKGELSIDPAEIPTLD